MVEGQRQAKGMGKTTKGRTGNGLSVSRHVVLESALSVLKIGPKVSRSSENALPPLMLLPEKPACLLAL